MTYIHKIAIVAGLATALAALAQTAPATPNDWMSRMDQQMTAMQGMHEQMQRADTPQERNALMVRHMALMQDGMSMMGSMGPVAMDSPGTGMRNMRQMMGSTGGVAAPADVAMRQQMLEKRMEMMQSMMQMTMDRLPPPPAKP